MPEQQKQLDTILEIVTFVKDNAVTKDEFNGLKGDFNDFKGEFKDLKSKVVKIESLMVTKDYLDEKMADLRGDLVVMMRKEDTKLKALVEILKHKQLISDKDVKQIMTMEPFAQIRL